VAQENHQTAVYATPAPGFIDPAGCATSLPPLLLMLLLLLVCPRAAACPEAEPWVVLFQCGDLTLHTLLALDAILSYSII
jgi:hypothetical protein